MLLILAKSLKSKKQEQKQFKDTLISTWYANWERSMLDPNGRGHWFYPHRR